MKEVDCAVVDRWIGTVEAAAILGTSTTTVRKMAEGGELEHRISPRSKRRHWLISEASAHAWVAAHGRIDDRRRRTATATAPPAVAAELAATRRERDRLLDDNVSLRDVALRLRARNEAIANAEARQARASQLLIEALAEQAQAANELRTAITQQDDALGQLLTPGAASRLGYDTDSPASAAPTA